MALTALGIAFYYCWDLTLVILATLPISGFILSFISARMQPSILGQQEEISTAVKNAIGAFSAIETIKCFNGQAFEKKQFADTIKRAAKYYVRQANMNAMQLGFAKFITLSMFVQGFWYGSHLVISGQKSTGDIITTFSCALVAMSTVEHILPQLMVLEKGRTAGAALKSVVMLLHDGKVVHEMSGQDRPNRVTGNIEFRNV